MKVVTLTFANKAYLDGLLGDEAFNSDAGYLNPTRLNDTNLIFYDSHDWHDKLASEDVSLMICGRVIRRLFFNSEGEIQYNTPFVLEMKGGINHNGKTPIITNTVVTLG